MTDKKVPCRKHREILLEIFLSGGEKADVPSALSRHLTSCDGCSRYWSNLGAVRAGYPQEPLYSPFLRAKTLRRLADRDQAFKVRWIPMVALATLLSLALSFVLPVWVLAKLFLYWTSSTAVACGAALAILLAGGALVTVVSTISLMERGYIRFGDDEVTQCRAGLPSAAGFINFH